MPPKEQQPDMLQGQDPQLNMIPATDKELGQLIVAEANYDRWSNFLFPHSKSNDLYGRRKKQWSITLPDGAEKSAQIEVIPAQDEKCYTTKTYDVFLAVTEIWKSRGMCDDIMEIHLGDIAKILDLKENGRVVNMIIEELRCLYDTKVSWVFSFHTSQTKDDTYKNQRVLETFDYVQKTERNIGHTKTTCSIRLSEHIRLNIRNKVTIPVNFSARKKIRSSIAKALYSRLDNILIHNKIYERKALGLIEDLNITPGRYKYKSQRKILLDKLQKSLDGAEMSRKGLVLRVAIRETSDGTDWKCVFRCGNASEVAPNTALLVEEEDNEEVVQRIKIIDDVVGNKELHYSEYRRYASCYDAVFLEAVVNQWLEITNRNTGITDKQKYFTNLMHNTVHQKGLDWVEDCGAQCPMRPENLIF